MQIELHQLLPIYLRRHWNKGIDIYNDACAYITNKNEASEIYEDFHFTYRDKISIV